MTIGISCTKLTEYGDSPTCPRDCQSGLGDCLPGKDSCLPYLIYSFRRLLRGLLRLLK